MTLMTCLMMKMNKMKNTMMTKIIHLTSLMLCSLLISAPLYGRDGSRQKTRAITLAYQALKKNPSFLALKKRTSLTTERVHLHCTRLREKVSAFEADCVLHASLRNTRLYRYYCEDMNALIREAEASRAAFTAQLDKPLHH